ncbi:unnamed protein product [Heterobilharzia americana]|nr:unnamed protein product [Heterobilharzia americana]
MSVNGVSCLRALCIQSHVVHGYVGNRSAVFPLQVLGIEVDFINSVQFSNHTGYDCVRGQVLDANDLKDIYLGLKANGLHRYTHVLTGYVGSSSFLEAVSYIVSDLKKENPGLKFYCDPVLGDQGKLYVPAELVQIYQEKILPLSDVLLPNQFEAELLSGMQIIDEESALNCINHLHKQYRISTVIITSTNVNSSEVMYGYASHLTNSMNLLENHLPSHQTTTSYMSIKPEYDRLRLRIPYLNCHFTGTGDLFAALTLARLETQIVKDDGEQVAKYSFKEAFQWVLSTMQAILLRTLKMSTSSDIESMDDMPKADRIELKLVQSIHDIQNPVLGDYVEQI